MKLSAPLFALIVFGAGVFGWLTLLDWLSGPSKPIVVQIVQSPSQPASPPRLSVWAKETLLCDQEVPLLLNSKDLVEVTRAGLLVNFLNCGIGSRTP